MPAKHEHSAFEKYNFNCLLFIGFCGWNFTKNCDKPLKKTEFIHGYLELREPEQFSRALFKNLLASQGGKKKKFSIFV
jgi:hypothetical protein